MPHSCIVDGCYRQAIYGPKDTMELFCKKHRPTDTVKLRRSCMKCDRRPICGYMSWSHCPDHATDGMTQIVMRHSYYIINKQVYYRPKYKTISRFAFSLKDNKFDEELAELMALLN